MIFTDTGLEGQGGEGPSTRVQRQEMKWQKGFGVPAVGSQSDQVTSVSAAPCSSLSLTARIQDT